METHGSKKYFKPNRSRSRREITWRKQTPQKSEWDILLEKLDNITSEFQNLNFIEKVAKDERGLNSNRIGPAPTLEKEFEGVLEKIAALPSKPCHSSTNWRNQKTSTAVCTAGFLLAMVRVPLCIELHFGSQVCTALARLLRHYQPKVHQGELLEISNFLMEQINASKGTLFAAEPLQATAQLVHGYGGRMSELYSSLIPLLLDSSHTCTVNLVAKQAVVGTLANLVVRGWPDLDKAHRTLLANQLVEVLESYWPIALEGDMEPLRLLATVLYGLYQVSQAPDGAKLLEPSLGKIFLALNSILQPVFDIGSNQSHHEDESDTSSLLCALEEGIGDSLRGLARITFRTTSHGLQLLAALCLKLPRVAQAHFHLFLPDHPVGPQHHFSPSRETKSGPKKAPLLLLILGHPAEMIRTYSMRALTALVKSVPWRLWLQTVRSSSSLGQGGHLSERALCAAMNILSCLYQCFTNEPSIAVGCEACICASSLIPELALPMSTSSTLLEATVPVLSLIGSIFFQPLPGSPRNVQGGPPLVLPSAAGRALTACFTVSNSQISSRAMVIFLERFSSEVGLSFVESLIQTVKVSASFKSESLLLLSRIANSYWNFLFPFWDDITETLKECLRNHDQNVRLHALKVIEETLKTRDIEIDSEGHTAASIATTSPIFQGQGSFISENWIVSIYQYLKHALKDPYHGVRSVACSCLGFLHGTDWVCIDADPALHKIINAYQDNSPGVRALAIKCVGRVASFLPQHRWCQDQSVTRVVGQVLLQSTEDTKVGVRAQAFAALHSLSIALFRMCSVLQEEFAQYEVRDNPEDDGDHKQRDLTLPDCSGIVSQFKVEYMTEKCLEGIYDQEKVAISAVKALGYFTILLKTVCFEQELLRELQERTILALVAEMCKQNSDASDKLVWNVCETIEIILKDSTIKEQLGLATWTAQLYDFLISQLNESKSYKVLIHAASALCIPSTVEHYKGNLGTVMESAFKTWKNIDDGGNFHQLKFVPMLKRNLRSLLLHTLLIWNLEGPNDFLFETVSIFWTAFAEVLIGGDAKMLLDAPRYNDLVRQKQNQGNVEVGPNSCLHAFTLENYEWMLEANDGKQMIGRHTASSCYKHILLKAMWVIRNLPVICVRNKEREILGQKIHEVLCSYKHDSCFDEICTPVLNEISLDKSKFVVRLPTNGEEEVPSSEQRHFSEITESVDEDEM